MVITRNAPQLFARASVCTRNASLTQNVSMRAATTGEWAKLRCMADVKSHHIAHALQNTCSVLDQTSPFLIDDNPVLGPVISKLLVFNT